MGLRDGHDRRLGSLLATDMGVVMRQIGVVEISVSVDTVMVVMLLASM